MSNDLLHAIDAVLNENRITDRHSFFQLRYFVVGKEPTIQSKMWQCLRELGSRRASINAIDLEVEEAKDQMELLDIERRKLIRRESRAKDELLKEEVVVRIRQNMRRQRAGEANLAELAKRKQNCLEEAGFFLEAFKALNEREKYKGFDDLESQVQYWSERIGQEVNFRLLLRQPIDPELAKTALALPNDTPAKVQVLGLMDSMQQIMATQRRMAIDTKDKK